MNPTPYLDARIAFTIGEDYAYFGLPVPAGADQSMLQGHTAGQARFPRRQPADRFVKKWLQIRVGAWKRNRVFENSITPELLAWLDNKFCPVSGVELTHATGLDTDWSVDRLNNDGAYAEGNLVVMSSRVNLIKGSLSWEEIQRYAQANTDALGLTTLEWRRMWRLVASTIAEYTLSVRECIPIKAWPNGLFSVWCLLMQNDMVSITKESAMVRSLLWKKLYLSAGANRSAVDEYKRHVEAYAKATPANERCAADFFKNDAAWNAYDRWWNAFKKTPEFESLANFTMKEAHKKGISTICFKQIEEEFSLKKKGYN